MSVLGRRVLIGTGPARQLEFEDLFTRAPLDQWLPLFADSFTKARYTQQHTPCDFLIIHEDLLEREGGQGLLWLAWQKTVPVVFLGDHPENFTRAYELGATTCVARDMAMAHPLLLAKSMELAKDAFEMKSVLERTRDQLFQTRRHVDRLVTMMWRSAPRQADRVWYSQPFMMERLQEELARAERHKIPLSLAIGELQPEEPKPTPETPLPDWTTDLIVREKRRCDVAGQYGPNNFMLLMVHTPKQGGVKCCKRLQDVIEHSPEPFPRAPLHAFFGMATSQGDRWQPQALLRSAEQNLESARAERAVRIVAD